MRTTLTIDDKLANALALADVIEDQELATTMAQDVSRASRRRNPTTPADPPICRPRARLGLTTDSGRFYAAVRVRSTSFAQ